MDFSHDNTPKPNPDSSADEGRSHFLETLGAGEEALTSLNQLRELTMRNKEGVVLSAQPDEIVDSVAPSEQPSPLAEIQLPEDRGLIQSEADSEKVESETKVAAKVKNVSVEIKAGKTKVMPLSESKPTAEQVDFGSGVSSPENGKKSEVSDGRLADLPLFSNVPPAKNEAAPAKKVSVLNEAKTDEVQLEHEVEALDEKEEEISSGAIPEQVQSEEELDVEEEASDVEAIETDAPEEVEESVSTEAPTTLVAADPAPTEQITLPCPKCEGELTLMREHLGIEGNCVWCHVPIVAAASGANGQVRIFPIQPEAAVFATPAAAPEPVAEEEIEEVVAETASPTESEEEVISEETQELEAEVDHVADDKEAVVEPGDSDPIPSGFEPEIVAESTEDLANEAISSGFEMAANEEMPKTLEGDSDFSSADPSADLASIGSLPIGFESSLPASPEDESPQEMIPSGFAPANSDPVSPSVTEDVAVQEHRVDLSSAPLELSPDDSSDSESLPAPVNDEPAIPSGFSSMASPIELDDTSDEEASALFTEPDPSEGNEVVAAGFSTPEPWGASPSPEVVAEETSPESIPNDFSAPAESASAAEPANSSEPWSALPPMPANDVDVIVPNVEGSSESLPAPAGFAERNDEIDAATMSGFAPTADLDAAPKALPPFPESSNSDGLSGFDIPSASSGESNFGDLEMSSPEESEKLSAPELPAPESASEAPAEEAFLSSPAAPFPEPAKEDAPEKGFGISFLEGAEEPAANSPFSDSPFAGMTSESSAVAEEPAESTPEEDALPVPVAEEAPANKIPEPEGPRVESKPLGSIKPKKKARKGFIVFMVILIGFVCGGALATFVLPIDEYVAVARGYMEAKFGVEGAASSDLLNLPSAINPATAPVAPSEPVPPAAN